MPSVMKDAEGIVYDSWNDVLYVSSGASPTIYALSSDGSTVLNTIDLLCRTDQSDQRI